MKSIIGTGAHKNHSSINRSFAFSTPVSFFLGGGRGGGGRGRGETLKRVSTGLDVFQQV